MPQYTIEKIKFGTDGRTFERAVGLYESGKVTRVSFDGVGYAATVLGSEPYAVYVRDKQHDTGTCSCYVGKEDVLCKHMVAVALYAVAQGRALTAAEKTFIAQPSCSGTLGEFDSDTMAACKKQITEALRYIRRYAGPSKTWFAYQNALDEGCSRLAAIVSALPVSKQTADVLVSLLLRMEKKLIAGGVDDSNGTVGECMQEIVSVLQEFTQIQPECVDAFAVLQGLESSFGWEEPLLVAYKTRHASKRNAHK